MGGKGEVEVYDFLLSTDYGVCYGPVDSINRIWVKDKPIWCGSESERVDVDVHLPELFGGDKKEGGVTGVVEFYPGHDDQVASEQLAWRVGLQPETMPAYRGLCHLFFRGRALANDPDGDAPPPPDVADAWAETIEALKDWFTGKGVKIKRGGFKWGTNNPYFPEIKMNVTRCPGQLDPAIAEIWQYGDPLLNHEKYYDADVKYVQKTGSLPNNESFGTITEVTDFLIAGARGYFQAELSAVFLYNGALGTPLNEPADSGAISITVRAYNANGAPVHYYENDVPPEYKTYSAFTTSYEDDGVYRVKIGPCAIHRDAVRLEIETVLYRPNPQTTNYYPTGPGNWELLTPSTAIHCRVDGALGPLPDANPMHMIYECQTNEEWGQGCPVELIDVANYQQVAQTLYDEGFGLSMIWTRQSTIADFISEILNHVRGLLFIDPSTGLWTCKLLRKEPDAESAPILNPSNAMMVDPRRRAWGETINEIVVSYTDPQTEEEATVSSYDFGNISMQGGVVSETRNYYGIRRADLAQRVADRDVTESAYPLFSCRFEVSKKFRTIRPGDVYRVDWPDEGISGMVVRVMKVDYGSPKERTIKIDVVEDIFSIDSVEYRDPQGSEWTPDGEVAKPLDATLVMSAPLPSLLRGGLSVDEIDESYPETSVTILGSSDTTSVVDIEVKSYVTDATGVVNFERIALLKPASSRILAGAEGSVLFPQEVETLVPAVVFESVGYQEPAPGDLFILGETEERHEFIMLKERSGSNWIVLRGIHDTVPREWVAGVRLWAYRGTPDRRDPKPRSAGEEVEYTLLPSTATGRLVVPDTISDIIAIQPNVLNYTVSERPHMPFRPANCQIDGLGFRGVLSPRGYPVSGYVASWSHRNRTTEDAIALSWVDESVVPEVGQTVSLVILDETGTEITAVTGLTGNEYTFSEGDFAGVEKGFVAFFSERDDIRSLMAAKRSFDFRASGYGLSYGNFYGGRTAEELAAAGSVETGQVLGSVIYKIPDQSVQVGQLLGAIIYKAV